MENGNLLYVARGEWRGMGTKVNRGVCEFIDSRKGRNWEILFEDNLMKNVFGIDPYL